MDAVGGLSQVETLIMGLDTLWVLLSAFLVFFMNLGFAMVETGLCRSKNAVNILSKNFIVFAIASLSFWFIGWGLMFGDGNAFVGLTNLFFANGGVDEGFGAISWARVPFWAKFFFQLVFAGTAATIVSGAVAERIKFTSFIVFATGRGHVPGDRALDMGRRMAAELLFHFASSTVVHSVGGWAGVMVLDPATASTGPTVRRFRYSDTICLW